MVNAYHLYFILNIDNIPYIIMLLILYANRHKLDKCFRHKIRAKNKEGKFSSHKLGGYSTSNALLFIYSIFRQWELEEKMREFVKKCLKKGFRILKMLTKTNTLL